MNGRCNGKKKASIEKQKEKWKNETSWRRKEERKEETEKGEGRPDDTQKLHDILLRYANNGHFISFR